MFIHFSIKDRSLNAVLLPYATCFRDLSPPFGPTNALGPKTESSSTSSSSIPHLQRLFLCQSRSMKTGHEDSPFNLVPIGSPALLINTQALSSNFTTLPSGLCSFFAVLTTTACLISPLRTLLAADVETLAPGPDSEKFRCFCTTTITRSPCHSMSHASISTE